MTPYWSRTHGFKERRNTSGAGKSGRRAAAHRPYRSDGRARGGKQGLVGPHLHTQPLWRGWDDEMSKGMCGMTEMGWLKFADVPPAAWLSFSRRLGGESEAHANLRPQTPPKHRDREEQQEYTSGHSVDVATVRPRATQVLCEEQNIHSIQTKHKILQCVFSFTKTIHFINGSITQQSLLHYNRTIHC